MNPLRNAVYNFLERKGNVCCLCFEAVETTAIRIDDEVFLNENKISKNVELSEVLAFIFGSDVDDLASETICKQCATSAINCYIFIKKFHENSRNFLQAIESLDNCLQIATEPERIQFCKSLFVSLDANASYAAKEYYDYKQPTTKRSAILKRFQSIASKKHTHYYLKAVKNNKDFDTNIKAPTVKQEVKKLKCKKEITTKHVTAEIPIPRHILLHKDSKPSAYKCRSCLKIYKQCSILKQHYLRVHAPKIFKCPKCECSYGSYNFLETHLKSSHVTCVCAECGKTFNNQYSLKQHELGHKLRFICQKCGRVYKNKDTFRDHNKSGYCEQTSRMSSNKGMFQCDICKKRFSRKNSVRNHIKSEHSDMGKPLECSWCGKKFSCQSRLKDHIPKHTKNKNFSCTICGGKFVTKSSLLYHTRIHTGEKPYECSACGQRFLNSSRRAEHFRRFHTDDTFNCDLCSAKYKDRSTLKQHMKRHSNPQRKLHGRRQDCF